MKVKVNGRNDGLIVRIGSCLIYPVRCGKGSSINDVMLFWGFFYPPPLSCFLCILQHCWSCGPKPPPPPLRHDVIYGRPRKNSKRSKKEGQRLPCDHHLSSHVLSHNHQPIFHQEFFSHTLGYFCFIVSIFLHCLPYFTD